jgi:small nuclear ribonucleoprotein (snRNP)-like protein
VALFGISFAEHQSALDDNEALQARVDELEAASRPTDWLESVMTKRILVHLTNNMTIDGSLVARYEDGIVLRAAKLLDDSGKSSAMAGETFVPRENVAFAQLDG